VRFKGKQPDSRPLAQSRPQPFRISCISQRTTVRGVVHMMQRMRHSPE
jgi:hypothetical protein